jgi:predicted nucleic acid-binding protein
VIVVDASVWIDFFNGRATDQVAELRRLIPQELLLVGDVTLCEVLRGARSDRDAARLEAALRRFELAPMLDPGLAVLAAAHYRRLRALGITIRKLVDLIIGTFCIEKGHVLLHADRDFEPMVRHLGLRTI